MTNPTIMSFAEIEETLKHSPAREDLQDDRDFVAGQILSSAPELPATFDLREQMSAVKNQGSRGTCTAYAAVAIAEYFNRAEHNEPDLDLSEEFVFKKTKEIDVANYGYDGYGAYLRSAAKAYRKYGACREATLPYEGGKPEDYWKEVAISPAALKEAAVFRASRYASVIRTENDIKQALVVTNAPLLAGIPVYENYREAKSNGGFFPAPYGKNIGGHAIAIVGWTETHFIFKNSWGSEWGDSGYCYWPIEHMEHMFSIWSFIDAENPALIEEKIIEANRKLVPEWALESWDKAIAKGVVTKDTMPTTNMTKAEYMVLRDRAGELD